MEALPITPTLSATATGPQSLGTSATGQTDAPASGLSFGGIFNQLQPEAGRQDFAASGLGATWPLPSLVSQPLGEAMAVITPDSPVPAQDSLLAFARSQGLDEAAIAALWQQPGSATATSTPQTTPAAPSASAAAMPLQWLGLVLPSPTAQTTPSNPDTGKLEPDPLLLQSLRLVPQALGMRMAQRPPTQSTAAATVLGDKAPASTTQDTPTLTLDLESTLAELVHPAVTSIPTDSSPATGSPPAWPPESLQANGPGHPASNNTTPSPAPTVISGYQLKAEHYQQLADRMGQALAQRLQEQIETGQWSLKLRLNPAELGQIDVQLDMHQGGLDARFQTDNPLTKDLILQGSGRLKESLNQHGMTVASVWVNSDERRQSGGNSTPQQQQRRTPAGPDRAPAESVTEVSAPRQQRPDGWDMMA